jgi:hypothetical protein
MTVTHLATRIALSGSLLTSGVVHAYLYVDGYRDIPTVGPAFLLQSSAFCALAVLILAGGPAWLRLAAAIGAAGSLLAFGLSRTGGLFGFIETGWQPAPYAVISVAAEVLTVLLVAANAWRRSESSASEPAPHPLDARRR